MDEELAANAAEQGVATAERKPASQSADAKTSQAEATISQETSELEAQEQKKGEGEKEVKESYSKAEFEQALATEKKNIASHFQAVKDKELQPLKSQVAELARSLRQAQEMQQAKEDDARVESEKEAWKTQGIPEKTIESIHARDKAIRERERKMAEADVIFKERNEQNRQMAINALWLRAKYGEVTTDDHESEEYKQFTEVLSLAQNNEQMETLFKLAAKGVKPVAKAPAPPTLKPDTSTANTQSLDDLDRLTPDQMVARGLRLESERRK